MTMPRQTNLAYDLHAAEPAREERRQQRILREPETSAEPARARGINLGYVLCMALAAVMLFMTVMSYARLSELNVAAAELQRELSALQTENTAILAAQDRSYNLAELAEYAQTHLGMTRANAENVVYIDLGAADEIVVPGKAAAGTGVLDRLRAGLDRVIEYFR